MANEAEALIHQGYQASREGRRLQAKEAFQQAIAAAKLTPDQAILAEAIKGLGKIERDLGETDASLAHYRQSVQLLRCLDDPLNLAHTVRHVGDILRESGQVEPAESCYAEALRLYRGHLQTPVLDLANTLRGYALLRAEKGDRESAITMWQEAGHVYGSLNLEAGVNESRSQVARLQAGKI